MNNKNYIWDFTNNIRYTKSEKNLYQSYNDLPALEYLHDETSTKIWMNDGYVHRAGNKPAYTKLINYFGFPEKVEYREYYNMGIIQKRTIAYINISTHQVQEILLPYE